MTLPNQLPSEAARTELPQTPCERGHTQNSWTYINKKTENQHGLSNKCVKRNSLRLYIALHLFSAMFECLHAQYEMPTNIPLWKEKKSRQTHHRYRSNNLPYDHLISLARQCTSHKTTDEALHHHEVAAPTMRRLKPRRLQVIYLVVLQHRAAERKDWNRTQIHLCIIFINTITCGAYFEFDLVNSSNKVLTSAVRYGPNFISR